MKKLTLLRENLVSLNLVKILSLLLLLVFVACDDNDDPQVVKDKGDFANGVFVLNQGNMDDANASVSFIAGDSVIGNLFTERNESDVLGDVLQDMASVDTLSFLVLNQSHSLMVVNNKNFQYVTELEEGINNPRYAVAHDGLIYVSQWGNGGEIAVVDPDEMSVISTIDVGNGPEGLTIINDELWVANSGGYVSDNIVSVIDVVQEVVKEEIEVSDCPQKVVVDANGDAWVLSAGYTEYNDSWEVISSTPSAIHKINVDDYEVVKTFLPDESVYGKSTKIAMAADGQSFYFGGGYGYAGVWKMPVDAEEIPEEKFADVTPNGMSVDPSNGDLYIGLSPSYTEPGSVEVFGTNGVKVATYDENIGVGPCNFIFVSE